MNSQEHETLSTHTSSVMVSLQFNNLILGSNFEPKIAGYSHGRLILPLLRVIRSPLSVDDLPLRTLFCSSMIPEPETIQYLEQCAGTRISKRMD